MALNTHSQPSAEGKERVELYLYSPSGPLWPVVGRTLPLLFLSTKELKYVTHTLIYDECFLAMELRDGTSLHGFMFVLTGF